MSDMASDKDFGIDHDNNGPLRKDEIPPKVRYGFEEGSFSKIDYVTPNDQHVEVGRATNSGQTWKVPEGARSRLSYEGGE
jgi:hypothetical protein